MQKAADAFRTISEVADDLSLPQHVLRFWETRFPQIRPLKRAGGRRYYRPADVTLLRKIRELLYDDGYTIKGVQRLLKEQGPKGLGAGARPGGDPDPNPQAVVAGTLNIDDDAMSTIDPSELLTELHIAEERTDGNHRTVIEDALSVVDECKHILEAALRLR